ncbi:MAG: thioredoxin family protein [Hyphomicrobiales bacterium]|nr:thioredoxin family protein [Hyphomicrobiales bacterium]MDE2115565.1 thioredoxin family protein [Hyphomicrobiales bacterium]
MILKRVGLSLMLWLGLALHALGAAGPWVADGDVQARLISAVDGSGQLAQLPLGLQVKMNTGWKTYWRSPGEAGLPPELDFNGSSNLGPVAIAYPVPQRFSLLGLETFGYEGEVVFPLHADVTHPGAAVTVKAKVDLLVCAQICVPHSLLLHLDIPAGAADVASQAQLLNSFATQVPSGATGAGLQVVSAKLMGAGADSVLEVDAKSQQPFLAPDVYPESKTLSFGHPQVVLSADRREVSLRLPVLHVAAGTAPSNAHALTLTLVDGKRFLEAHPQVVAASLPSPWLRLWGLVPIFGLALIGGFILNFMPCVLPILSMKLLTVVSHGGREDAHVRAGFLASAAGILASMLALAGVLVAMKASGHTVGWGIQFQQPLFVVALVVVLTLFACNLWGFFEINLPIFVQQKLGQAGDSTLPGHFASGAFATLLATPCSAPFLGTAVGFALASGPMEIFVVFFALGLGLSLPLLVVAVWPGLATRLPKPGRWMVWLRQILGFALAATALWLLYVAYIQIGDLRVGVVAASMLGVIAAFGLLRNRLHLAATIAGVCALLAVAAAQTGDMAGVQQAPERDIIRWSAFNDNQVKNLVSQGHTVFVDVTADWCLTCKANKRVVLDSAEIAKKLNQSGVTDMKADWTRPDPAIAQFLAQHGRYGIPFNIVYGPKAPAGVVMPEVLTEAIVLSALSQAQGVATPQ